MPPLQTSIRLARALLFGGVLALAVPGASGQPASETLWTEDWEGDFTDHWFVDAGTWEVGVPTSGPEACHSPSSCAATVLDGPYAQPVDSRLIRFTSFTVPPASETPRLRFWHWFSFEQGDYGAVQVSTDGGTNWDTVSAVYTWTGSNAWTYPLIDLSDYGDQTIQVAFYFHSECTRAFCPDVSTGWYIDDVVVESGPLVFNSPEGFESGTGHWASEAGSWQVGQPTSGPAACHSPPNCAATVLGGPYAQPVDSRLVSPPFVVPDSDANPALQFWHWYSFAQGDSGTIRIRVADGDWETLGTPFANTSSNAWTFFSVPVHSYSGQEVQIAFDFHAVCTQAFCPDVSTGWYVDDVRIEGLTATGTPAAPRGALVVHGVSPNPAVSSVTIDIGLLASSDVSVRIYDVLGRQVTALDPHALPAGRHSIRWAAGGLPGGVYVYRVEARAVGRTDVRAGRVTLLE